MKRTILFIGGGIETVPGIETAKSMGLDVVVSDINPDAPCVKIADHFLNADTYSVNQTLKKVHEFSKQFQPINGVICLGTDVPLTVACVAKELNLSGSPIKTAEIVSDKIIMKECFKKHNLPIPWFCEIHNFQDLCTIVKKNRFPLIIKPVDSRGARGVLRLTEKVDLEWAFKTALSYSPSKRIMVEQFLDGPQISTESLVINKEVFTFGFSDRNYEFLKRYEPHVIENGGDLPSILPEKDQNSIKAAVEKTANVLNITNGVIKGDMVLSNGSPYIIEVASRLSGGYFCTHEIPLNTGVDFVRIAIHLAMGDEINPQLLKTTKNQHVSQRYFFPKPGIIKEIIVPDWISKNKNISLFEIRLKVGDEILETTHHPSRAGLVITLGNNREDAISLAEKVVKEVCFVTE